MSTYLYKKRILKLSILFDVVLFESDSEEDFATHIVNECYDLERMMGNLSYYFDYKAFARDLFISDYIFEDGYVFHR